MTIRALIVCVLGQVMAVTLSAQDANKQDLDRLQGDWIRVSEQIGGSSTPAADLKEMKVTIRGNQWQWDAWLPRKVVTKDVVTITLDASTNPKIFDRTTTGGQKLFGRGATSVQRTVPGIYKLEGDTLTICTKTFGVRPKDFTTTSESGRVTVFKRAEN